MAPAVTVRGVRSKGFGLLLCWLLLLLQGALVGALPSSELSAPAHDHHNNALDTRLATQFPDFPKDYQGRVEKGVFLLTLCRLSEEMATEMNDGRPVASPFQKGDVDLRRWGWAKLGIAWGPFHGGPFDLEDRKVDPLLPKIVGNTENLAQVNYVHKLHWYLPEDKKEDALNKRQHWAKPRPGRPIRLGSPTFANSRNFVQPELGAILFFENFGPRYQIQSFRGGPHVPELENVSDLVFWQWWEVCTSGGWDPKELHMVYRNQIILKSSFYVIMKALEEAGRTNCPDWNDRLILPIDTPEALAILGTVHGAAVAMLLIQHKAQLGSKTISDVTIWGGTGAFPLSHTDPKKVSLNLRFGIVDA